MENRFLRRKEVEKMVGLARSSIYDAIGRGEFPRPVRVGDRAVRWKFADICEWMNSRRSSGESGKAA